VSVKSGEFHSAQKEMEGGPLSSWAATLFDYFDAKARLVATESREASRHLVLLLVLIAAILVLSVSAVLIYGAFLLYAIGLIFHLAWGWSALISGTIAILFGFLVFLWFRIEIRKPVFKMSLQDLQKDKEWLIQSRTKAV
jgi:cytochrome c biogenesis protein CcdA